MRGIACSSRKMPPAAWCGKDDVWHAIRTEPWIIIEQGYDSGTGSGTVRFTYTDNDTGLTYTLREGTALHSMSDGATKQGDGQPWTPPITVKGGTSGFYSIKVTK